MKKFLFPILLLLVAIVGFSLGRSSLSLNSLETFNNDSANESYPLPPPPPESQPFVPGVVAENASLGVPLLLETPIDGASVTPPFSVSGRAIVDQGQLLVAIVGSDDREVYSRRLDIVSGDDSGYGRFDLSIGDIGQVGEFILRVSLLESEDSNAIQTRQISFGSPSQVNTQIYFLNSNLDPEIQCNRVFPVTRLVSSRGNVFKSVLEELLIGPEQTEIEAGYQTSIPTGVKIKSVGIDATGTVTVDFDKNLERETGGSCRVIAIRSQIESTLKQFPEVRKVLITVEGEEEILQP